MDTDTVQVKIVRGQTISFSDTRLDTILIAAGNFVEERTSYSDIDIVRVEFADSIGDGHTLLVSYTHSSDTVIY